MACALSVPLGYPNSGPTSCGSDYFGTDPPSRTWLHMLMASQPSISWTISIYTEMVQEGDIEKATQNLKAKQKQYCIDWLQEALETESHRKLKLERVTSREEAKRLEHQFEKERAREKERLQQINEDHQLILKAKVAEWKAHGVPSSMLEWPVSNSLSPNTARTDRSLHPAPTARTSKQKPRAAKQSTRAAIERLAVGKPPSFADFEGDEEKQAAFQKAAIRKQDRQRLFPSPSQASVSSQNLKALTETDLLQHKLNLLSQLHGVVAKQERIVQDDQVTVRSTVSSWKSADFQTSGP